MSDIGTEELANFEWADLKRSSGGSRVVASVTVALIKKKHCKAGVGLCRAYAVVWLRREAGEWIEYHGPSFNVQIAGDAANFLRIVPDVSGNFRAFDFKGIKKLSLSCVNVWPDEDRRNVEAKYKITPGGLVVIFPDDFAEQKSPAEGRRVTIRIMQALNGVVDDAPFSRGVPH